ncbi:hypothetical protein AAG570_014100 [Ranatra chinensis]|uniref:ZAD domain-containing protein n=1 Tax=Ranatra chinensis TaxID=642074 RepID=A0ABD0XS06_9HEMI
MEDETVSPFGEDTCRLCGLGDAVLPICGRRADGDNLRRNIGKFLAITVCENDALPKMVCLVCFSHLKKMEEFAAMAARTQTKLLECVRSSGSGGGEAEAEAGGGDRSGDHRLQPPPAEGLEDRLAIQDKEQVAEGCQASEKANVALIASADDVQGSLLHSILTKGQSGQGGGGSGEVVESGSVTELEVRVDPMLFLCDQEDTEEPPVSANNNNNNNSNNNNNNHSNEDSPPSPRTSTSDESTATISEAVFAVEVPPLPYRLESPEFRQLPQPGARPPAVACPLRYSCSCARNPFLDSLEI